MQVFVDESGDTGFKLEAGSSPQFTITLIIFPENAEAEAASHGIDQLRVDLGMSADSRKSEFHFNDSSNYQRDAFLTAVKSFGFSIFSVTLNKAGWQAKASAPRARSTTLPPAWLSTMPKTIL